VLFTVNIKLVYDYTYFPSIPNLRHRKKGFSKKLDKIKEKIRNQKTGQKFFLLTGAIALLGMSIISLQEKDSLNMGVIATPSALEAAWRRKSALFLRAGNVGWDKCEYS